MRDYWPWPLELAIVVSIFISGLLWWCSVNSKHAISEGEKALSKTKTMAGYGYKLGGSSLFMDPSKLQTAKFEWMFVVRPDGKFVFNSDNGDPITLTGNQIYEMVKRGRWK